MHRKYHSIEKEWGGGGEIAAASESLDLHDEFLALLWRAGVITPYYLWRGGDQACQTH